MVKVEPLTESKQQRGPSRADLDVVLGLGEPAVEIEGKNLCTRHRLHRELEPVYRKVSQYR